MKFQSLIGGLIITISMAMAVGPAQATCMKKQPGWHMVSKHCSIRAADNWQEYNSGVYTQPAGRSFLFLGQ